jgi:hypothetical protein
MPLNHGAKLFQVRSLFVKKLTDPLKILRSSDPECERHKELGRHNAGANLAAVRADFRKLGAFERFLI